jgi:hypothetical protein
VVGGSVVGRLALLLGLMPFVTELSEHPYTEAAGLLRSLRFLGLTGVAASHAVTKRRVAALVLPSRLILPSIRHKSIMAPGPPGSGQLTLRA